MHGAVEVGPLEKFWRRWEGGKVEGLAQLCLPCPALASDHLFLLNIQLSTTSFVKPFVMASPAKQNQPPMPVDLILASTDIHLTLLTSSHILTLFPTSCPSVLSFTQSLSRHSEATESLCLGIYPGSTTY